MNIRKITHKIIKKYGTSNPFKLTELMNIIILFEEFEDIKGFYNKCYRQKFIHLNSRMNEKQMQFTLAHELGHAVLHPDANTPFLRNNTLFSVNRLEQEANIFACELIYPDSIFTEYKEYSVYRISEILEINIHLVEYRMKNLS